MKKIIYKPIGIIHTPFKKIKGMPLQAIAGKGIKGTIELYPQFIKGLKDIGGFSHLILIYHFHQMPKDCLLEVTPVMDKNSRGLFSTRAPRRPNALGISIVRLLKVKGSVLQIEDIDILDGTPLLDIKPYVPEIDSRKGVEIGWMKGKVKNVYRRKADERFIKK